MRWKETNAHTDMCGSNGTRPQNSPKCANPIFPAPISCDLVRLLPAVSL